MTIPWKPKTNRSEESQGGEDRLSMIPAWSVVLSILVFAAFQYLFHGVMPHHKHEMLPMRLLMGYSWGTAFASYVLIVGYVSRDVKRRNMPAGLWMLIVVLMPGGIGAVVYFLGDEGTLSCPPGGFDINTQAMCEEDHVAAEVDVEASLFRRLKSAVRRRGGRQERAAA